MIQTDVKMVAEVEIANETLVVLRKIIRAIDLQSRVLVQRCGLTAPQLVVLKELSRKGELSAGCLAAAVSLSQATVTGVVDRLLRRGLVEKVRDEQDRRRVLLSCTAQGKALADGVPSVLQERFTEQLGRLAGWEQHLILSSLQRIHSMMEAEAIEAEPMRAGELPQVSVAVARPFRGPSTEEAPSGPVKDV